MSCRATTRPHRLLTFDGGLNLQVDPIHLAPNETPDCSNVDFDSYGAVTRRNGYTAFGSSWSDDYPADCLFPFWNPVDPPREMRLLVIRHGEKPLWFKPDGTSETVGTLTQSALGGETVNVAVLADEQVFVVNGTDGTLVVKPDKTTQRLDIGTDAADKWPLAKTLEYHKNRIFMANSGSELGRMYWTGSDANPTDTHYVKSTSYIDVAPDGWPIQRMVSYFNSLVIFKRRGLFLLRGNDPRDFTIVPLDNTVGALSAYTVCQWQGGILYLSPEGVMNFDGTTSRLVSQKVNSVLGRLRDTSDRHRRDFAVIHNNKYYLWIYDNGSRQTTYVLDLNTLRSGNPVWTRYKGMAMATAASWRRDDYWELFGVDDTDQNTVNTLLSGNSDGGSKINAYFKTPWINSPDAKRRTRRVWAQFKAVPDGA